MMRGKMIGNPGIGVTELIQPELQPFLMGLYE